jgi:hypothetical protein
MRAGDVAANCLKSCAFYDVTLVVRSQSTDVRHRPHLQDVSASNATILHGEGSSQSPVTRPDIPDGNIVQVTSVRSSQPTWMFV